MKITEKIKSAGLAVAALALGLALFSCSGATEKAHEKALEHALENATGEKTDVTIDGQKTTIETEQGTMEVDTKATTWPDEIPDAIPEFTFGRIDAVSTIEVDGTTTYTISYKEVADGFVDKYNALLKEKGFETAVFKTGTSAGTITAENESFIVALMGSEGSVALSVQVIKQE